jgi:hypothetical protein
MSSSDAQSFFLETEPKQTQGFILRHLLYQMALLELLAPYKIAQLL